MGNEQGKLQGVPTPAGIQSMDESLQKKFAKGIQFNMKIVIRGDRNTGKTSLFHRMEGKPFSEAYLPTNEIQVTSILWSYRVTNDTVKVEIWDVVDKGRAQKAKGGKGSLKMFNSPDVADEEEGQTLDASFLDVYKGAHGVVFTFDITKQWTWKYIERELPQVPLHIPIIILGNFMDLSEHRLVTKEDCYAMLSILDRPDGAANIRYAECSMRNGFGLMHLHKFLSIPFLQLQQETLLQQLQVNREQTLAALEELDSARSSEDQNYNLYLAKLQRMAEERKSRARQEMQDSMGEEGSYTPVRRDTLERSTPSATPPRSHKAAPAANPAPPTSQPQPPSSGGAKLQKTSSITSKFSKFAGFLGKGKEEGKEEEERKPETPKSRPKVVSNENIEEFVPEGSVDFLESDEEEAEEEEEEDSEEDSDEGNPMIAADEDLSSPEEPDYPVSSEKPAIVETPSILTHVKAPSSPKQPKPSPKQLKSARDIELTESEEEEEEEEEEASENRAPTAKAKPLQLNGQSQKLEDIFEPPRSLGKKKPENKGLMLQFASNPSPSASPKVRKDVDTPTEESPEQKRRKEKKKKKSKKSKSSKEEDGGLIAVSGGQESVQETSRTDRSGSLSGTNPYSAIASLDAWLNSDDTGALDDFLTPTKVTTGTTEMGTEEGVEPEEQQQTRKKKHRHKKKEEGEEGGGHRRKHRSHKSSRHRSIEQTD